MKRNTKHRKKRSLLRRLLRGFLRLIALALIYSIVAGYLPFARCPQLSAEEEAALEQRAEEMQKDVETADRAVILETRTDALEERLRLIEQAQHELILTTYECRDGESTRDVLAAVMHKAEQGVQVRMLVDGISGRMRLLGSDLFQAVAAHPNVEIRFYNMMQMLQAWKHMGRMHDKYIIVDDLAYILGGRNTFDYFLGEYPAPTHSNDREALVYNGAHGTDASGESSLFQVRAYFEGMWALDVTTSFPARGIRPERSKEVLDALEERYQSLRAAKPELFAPCDYAEMTLPTRGIWLVSNPTTIYAKKPVVFRQLCALMALARQDIVYHSPYAVLNADMRERLSAIAQRTPVTLMINAVENGENFVASSDYLYHKGEVLSTGVRLLEYAGGDSYHGKSVAIDDDLSVIGSFNLDLRSTYVDTELMLVIRGREVNASLRANMDALHADCRQVIDAQTEIVPDGLVIPPVKPLRRALMRINGALMQLVRNLV